MKRKTVLRLLLVGLVFMTFVFIAQLISPALFSYVIGSREYIAQFIAKNFILSVFIFFLIYIVDNIFALPIASLLTILAGIFYPPLFAILITLLAATVGASVAFTLSRHFIGKTVQQKYALRLAYFNKLFDQYGVYYLVLVRLIPIIPFVLVNMFAGLTLVSIRTFLITTFFGMIPVTVVLVLSGRELQQAVSLLDLLSGKIIIFLFVLVFLALLPLLLKKMRVML